MAVIKHKIKYRDIPHHKDILRAIKLQLFQKYAKKVFSIGPCKIFSLYTAQNVYTLL